MQSTPALGHSKHELRHHERRIEQLAPSLVSKIKSSAAISDLNQVICGLYENALDAGATKVVIQVARSRGACVIDDNGSGIAPIEFTEQGGLCKIHCTSKQSEDSQTHGHHGTFLASLAALSLLAITSKHESYRSTNRLLVHRTDVLSRSTPVAEPCYLIDAQHGSRVSVQDLFGNMPVRVKYRQLGSSGILQTGRLFETLKLNIVAYLLAWPHKVTVKLWDVDTEVDTLLSNGSVDLPRRQRYQDSSDSPSFVSTALLRELMHDQVWIPAAASSKTLAIKGVIGLKPVASRSYQFLSIGIKPILAETGVNVLYHHINTLFKNSHFGVVNNASCEASQDQRLPGTIERVRLQDLKASRRGVDRWPMFNLCLTFRKVNCATAVDVSNDTQILELVLDALTSLITQWLRAQHIKPGTVDCRQPKSAALSLSRRSTDSDILRAPHQAMPGHKESAANQSELLATSIRVIERASPSNSHSIIRSLQLQKAALRSMPLSLTHELPQQNGTNQAAAASDSEIDQLVHDCTTVWTDPVTSNDHLVNARTGMSGLMQPLNHRLTLRPSSAPMPEKQIGWLDDLRESWTNPVFKPIEQQMLQFGGGINTPAPQAIGNHESCHHCPGEFSSSLKVDIAQAGHKLSREALKGFRLIAQVDCQYILVGLPTTSRYRNLQEELVMVDQHAADERVQVEALYAEVCDPGRTEHERCTHLHPPLIFELSSQEAGMFKSHISYFGRWDIRCFLVQQDDSTSDRCYRLQVDAIPKLIADRCKAEPQLLLSMLRHHIWNSKSKQDQTKSNDKEVTATDEPSWLHRIGDCPEGMVNMLNSRACRSAIMFNDQLTAGECNSLMTKLAKCAFPFQCAHGRPSLVPLLRMELLPDLAEVVAHQELQDRGSFLKAYKSWINA